MAECAPVLVKARHNFNGRNNDELSFAKNEIITLTQQLDGGWWEGTLNGTTGYFPSNYVDVVEQQTETNGHGEATADLGGALAQRQAFRATVVREFTVSESLYVSNLKDTLETYLLPVKEGLVEEDWQTLSFNFSLIADFHASLFKELENTFSLEFRERKVGGILLNRAAELRTLLTDYCYNHPRAIEVVNEKNDYLTEKMTSQGKTMLDFVARLSEPFRHLDRYPPFLQELERSMDEDHRDRGNVQRACVVFKELKVVCEATRKQKEGHMELFHAAPIEEWAPFEERGKILYVGIVQAKQDDQERERCVAVFTKMILVMEITGSSQYKLESKIHSAGLFIRRQEEGFNLASSEATVFLCTSEVEEWTKAFLQMEGVKIENAVVVTGRPPTPQQTRPPVVVMRRDMTPTSQPAATEQYTPIVRAREKKTEVVGELKLNHELGLFQPDGLDEVDSPSSGGIQRQKSFSLKPTPLQRCNSLVDGRKSVKMRKEMPIVDPDDPILLRIVEGYCGLSSGKTSTGPTWQQPQLIVADNEKILIEEVVGDEIVLQEKSLVDTVYSMKDQLAALQQEVAHLHKCLDREQRSRRRLEDSLKRLSDQPRSPSPRD